MKQEKKINFYNNYEYKSCKINFINKMKKIFILLLIIYIVSCKTIKDFTFEELNDISLEGLNPAIIKDIWQKIKDIYEKAVKFLKDVGLYEPIINLIKEKGRKIALNFCVSKNIPKETCESIIDWILKYIK